ncbi:methylmalonyl-CoA epimerase [Rubeoparvulum massiliense]|uniref:methylmalonyl-CoA epimerase n=1 Tax=Rubeoparvulum massiliense TaxID=1631346 RepID=UPI00065E0350|nr:methylmalonyl-CoA epimerase [Rubeoparvulum massiliense]
MTVPLKIAHIGIAVHDLTEAVLTYERLGFQLERIEHIEQEGVKVAFLQIGETYLELLQPLHDESPVARFLAKRGEGIHHIAYEVADVEKTMERLDAEGLPLLSDKAKDGAGGMQIAFLHPRSTHGVLTEFCSKKGDKE